MNLVQQLDEKILKKKNNKQRNLFKVKLQRA